MNNCSSCIKWSYDIPCHITDHVIDGVYALPPMKRCISKVALSILYPLTVPCYWLKYGADCGIGSRIFSAITGASGIVGGVHLMLCPPIPLCIAKSTVIYYALGTFFQIPTAPRGNEDAPILNEGDIEFLALISSGQFQPEAHQASDEEKS